MKSFTLNLNRFGKETPNPVNMRLAEGFLDERYYRPNLRGKRLKTKEKPSIKTEIMSISIPWVI